MSMMNPVPDAPAAPVAQEVAPIGAEQPLPAAGEAESPEGQEPKPERTFSQKEVDEIARKIRKNEAKRADRSRVEAERAARAEAERDFLLRQQTEKQPQSQGRPQAKDRPAPSGFFRFWGLERKS
jgi:hypothetical protein